jgi:hypothetical protein
MILDRVLGAGRNLGSDLRCGRCFRDPRRFCRHLEKDRSGEMYRCENIRQRVRTHRRVPSMKDRVFACPGRKSKSAGRPAMMIMKQDV